MNRAVFFEALRRRNSGVFGSSLKQSQVQGVEAILDECLARNADLGQAAYILGTGYGETGGRMQPVRENMRYSARRLTEVWPRRFPTLARARPYAHNPRKLANKVYNGRMGNGVGTDDGYDFRGNGIGQITGRENHRKFGDLLGEPLLQDPRLLEDLGISVRALVHGMLGGWATGIALSRFVDGNRRDFLGARKVWGGVDPAKYQGLAQAFEAALEEAGYMTQSPVRPDVEPPISHPDPAAKPTGFLGAFLALLRRFFGGSQ